MRAASRSDSGSLAAGAKFVGDVVGLETRGDDLVDRRLVRPVDHGDEVVDTVRVDGHAEAVLGLDLVALGHRDVAHVVAEADDAAGCAAPAPRCSPGPT